MKRTVFVCGALILMGGCVRVPSETTQGEDNLNLAAEDGDTVEMATDSGMNMELDEAPETITTDEEAAMADTMTLQTSKGAITLKLYADDAPNTVKNFMEKAESGFYENLTFHRVEDWVVQGGDPDGNGTGGGTMPTELNDRPFKTGSLGVARGPNIQISNDSQFFICTQDCDWLTGQYTNFGEVVAGMDVVTSIEFGDTIESLSIAE